MKGLIFTSSSWGKQYCLSVAHQLIVRSLELDKYQGHGFLGWDGNVLLLVLETEC